VTVTDRAVSRGRFAYTPPLAAGDEEPERVLVVVLSDPDRHDEVDVAFASYEVQLATPDWLALLPAETGLSGPVCVLVDSTTAVAAEVLTDAHGALGDEALALVAAARRGAAPAERLGSPVITPDLDRRTPVLARYRAWKAALERATDERTAPATASRTLLRPLALGWAGARADSASAPSPPVWIPDEQAQERVALSFRHDDGSLTLTAHAERSLQLAVVELDGVARLLVPLVETRIGCQGDARLHDVSSALRGLAAIPVSVEWHADTSAVASGNPADLRASVLAARPSLRARRRWAEIAATLPEGPQRSAIETALS
jgi:hypothetical protein